MKHKFCLVLLAFILLSSLTMGLFAQTTSSAIYSGGDVVSMQWTDPSTTTYSSGEVRLTIPIPVGAKITSVDVSYSMTTTPGSYSDGQRSYLRCSTTGGVGAAESSVAYGYYCGLPDDIPRTINYSRTGLTIANGITSGGNIVFDLEPFTVRGYNTTIVNNNTFTVTVHHGGAAAPTSFNILPNSSTALKLSWQSNSSVLLAYNTTNSFVEPTDGVSYTTGSNLGTATVLYAGNLHEYIHSNLDSLTTYYYRIWSYSESHYYSNGVSTSGTPATPISFPFTESFGSTFPPAGWSNIILAVYPWYLQTSGYDNSGYCARYVLHPQAATSGMLITPALTFSSTRYRLSFWMYRNSAANVATYLKVMLNSSKSSTGGTEIVTIPLRSSLAPVESSSGWYQYSYILNVNPYDIRYIIFLASTPKLGGLTQIDEIRVEELADLPQGEVTSVEDIAINPSEDIDLDNSVNAGNPIITGLSGYASLGATRVVGLSGTGNSVNISVTAPAGSWYGSIYYAGSWHQATPAHILNADADRIFSFTGVDFTAKAGEVIILLSEGEAETLPVTLSSFTAVAMAQSFVSLTWVSESESQMLGYRVYRNESTDFNNATMITPTMISATNTSTQVTYRHEDREVALNTTYYYWLESVDMASTEMHGPITATVTGNSTPELPTATVMSNVYPNPFRMGSAANIDVAMKAGDTGTVTVYNILGQSVKTFPVTPGTQKLTWNGRDSKGNACGSGIYFYQLSTPSMSQTKKMVIMK